MTAPASAPQPRIVVPFILFTLIWGSTWIVIRGQIDVVPAQWSVAYRFWIAAAGMALVAKWKGDALRPTRPLVAAALILGVTQFAMNFNAVYLAERFITSGVVACVFALLLIPSSLLGWAFLGQKPGQRFVIGSLVAIGGIALLFVHELAQRAASAADLATGIGWTIVGMVGASIANVYQAREPVKALPLFSLLTWAMLVGAIADTVLALTFAGPPVATAAPGYWLGLVYLALAASVLTFSLYYPVVRAIGPGKAAYSSMLVPIIAMGFSTWLEDYRWTAVTASGALLALLGMAIAMAGKRAKVAAPDAA